MAKGTHCKLSLRNHIRTRILAKSVKSCSSRSRRFEMPSKPTGFGRQIFCPEEIGLPITWTLKGIISKRDWFHGNSRFCFSFAVISVMKRIFAKSAKPTISGSKKFRRPSKPTVVERWHEKNAFSVSAEKRRHLPKTGVDRKIRPYR